MVGTKVPGPQAWLGSNQTADNNTTLPAMGVRHLKADPPAPIFSHPAVAMWNREEPLPTTPHPNWRLTNKINDCCWVKLLSFLALFYCYFGLVLV